MFTQYTPVASMATVSIRHALSHAAMTRRSAVKLVNRRLLSPSRSSGTQT